MTERCILCDAAMARSETGVPTKEDPDLVCAECRALPPHERSRLRARAVARLMRSGGETSTV